MAGGCRRTSPVVRDHVDHLNAARELLPRPMRLTMPPLLTMDVPDATQFKRHALFPLRFIGFFCEMVERECGPTMWNEFLPISMPITAIAALSF
jgi:hypothetical protein